MRVPDTLDFLLGEWRVDRSLVDRRTGIRGSFGGTAVIAAHRADLDGGDRGPAQYSEMGELHFGCHVGPARRSLEYRREGSGAVMSYFADGRPFVHLDLRTGGWHGDHLCGDDRYQMDTLVRSRDLLEERWQVHGPTKRYDAVTTMLRLV